MNCQSAREAFPALLDRRSAATEHLEARAHLANCPDCQREFAALSQTLTALDAMPTPSPSPRLRTNFYAMLEEEKHSAASVRAATERAQRARRANRWRWILAPSFGCALLLLGFMLGTRYASSAARPAVVTDAATQRQLEELQKKVDTMGRLVVSDILERQQGSTNERLREVLAAAKQEQPSHKALEEMLLSLALDPSTVVRLRALEGLYPHLDKDFVRAGVLAALPREQNPLVQLELIEFVATAGDQKATPVLEQISQDELIDRSVRDAARRALAQL